MNEKEASEQQTNRVQQNVKELFNLLLFVAFFPHFVGMNKKKKNIVYKSAIIIPERNDGENLLFLSYI